MISRICLCLISVTCVTAAAYSAEKGLLQWKLSTGDALRYTVQNEMVTTATVGGFDSKTRLLQTMQMTWNVKTTTASHNYVLSQVIRRIRVEMSPDGQKSIVFDSGSRESPDDPIVRSLGNVFRKIVDRNFMITMAPTGAIEDVAIPEDLLETLKLAAAGTPTGLDEKALKQMLSQTSVILPTKQVDKGDQWQSHQTVELPFATLRMDATMTHKGIDTDGLTVIDYSPKVTLEPKKNTPIKLTLRNSQGTGKILFDQKHGRVVQMTLNLHMDMETAVRGKQVLQKIDQQTLMNLRD